MHSGSTAKRQQKYPKSGNVQFLFSEKGIKGLYTDTWMYDASTQKKKVP